MSNIMLLDQETIDKIAAGEVEADIEFLESSERKFWKQVQERRKPDLILPEI